jgi:hypothetical protein
MGDEKILFSITSNGQTSYYENTSGLDEDSILTVFSRYGRLIDKAEYDAISDNVAGNFEHSVDDLDNGKAVDNNQPEAEAPAPDDAMEYTDEKSPEGMEGEAVQQKPEGTDTVTKENTVQEAPARTLSESIDSLKKILTDNNQPEAALALDEVMEYINKMNNNYRSMEDEIQNIKLQLTLNQVLNTAFVNNTISGMENENKGLKAHIDEFVHKLHDRINGILQDFKDNGVIALNNTVKKLGLKEAMESERDNYNHSAERYQKRIDKLDTMDHEYNEAKAHLKNIGRAATGKELLQADESQNALIRLLKAPCTQSKARYMEMATNADKLVQKYERLEERAGEAVQRKTGGRESVLGKLEGYKNEIASKDAEKREEEPVIDKQKKEPEMAI